MQERKPDMLLDINDGKAHSIPLENMHLSDLNPLLLGYEYCMPGKSFGPTVRKYVLIHYIVSGKGYVIKGGRKHTVSAGQAFIIRPGEVTIYTADDKDPWLYHWVAFDGALSEKFNELDHVFPFPSDITRKMLETDGNDLVEYRIAELLFKMYVILFGGKKRRHHYISKVEDHIRAAYMHPLRVEDIASKMNLERHYLTRIFKEKTGLSISDYIINVRIEEAKNYLIQGFSVEETARMCGYEDASNFSKLFKREVGISPAYWKKQYR
jgi:AraC-like DNA-binding protein